MYMYVCKGTVCVRVSVGICMCVSVLCACVHVSVSVYMCVSKCVYVCV